MYRNTGRSTKGLVSEPALRTCDLFLPSPFSAAVVCHGFGVGSTSLSTIRYFFLWFPGGENQRTVCSEPTLQQYFLLFSIWFESRTPSAHRGTSTDKITVIVEHPNGEDDYVTNLTTEREEHRVEAAKGEGGSTYRVCFQNSQSKGRSTRVEVRECTRWP